MIYGIWFSSSRMLIGGFSTLYLIHHGLDLSDIAYLKGLQALVILLSDVPLGYVADRYSRRFSVIVGVFFGAIWLAMTAWAPSIGWFYAAEVCNAVSLALFNGAYDALLVDTCLKEQPAVSIEKIISTYVKYQFLVMSAAALAGGLFIRVDSSSIWWVGALLLFVQVVFLGSFVKDLPEDSPVKRVSGSWKRLREDLSVIGSKFTMRNTEFALVFCSGILLMLYYQTAIQYWQPIVAIWTEQDTRGYRYSILFVLILLTQSLAGKWTPAISRSKHGFPSLVGGFFAASWLLHTGIRVYPCLILPSIVITFFIIRGVSIQLGSFINERMESSLRATYSSIQSTLARICMIVSFPIVGWLTRQYGLISIASMGVLISVLIAVLVWSTSLCMAKTISKTRSVP